MNRTLHVFLLLFSVVAGLSCAHTANTTADQVAGGAAIAVELIAKQGTGDKKWAFSGVITSVQIVTNIPAGDAVLSTISGRITGVVTPTQYSA